MYHGTKKNGRSESHHKKSFCVKKDRRRAHHGPRIPTKDNGQSQEHVSYQALELVKN